VDKKMILKIQKKKHLNK